MSHDKIRAAARKRMAETGEPYATARREVIKNYQDAGAGPGAAPSSGARWFAIDYSDMGRVSLWTDTLLGGGPGHGGVELNSTVLRVLVPGFLVLRPHLHQLLHVQQWPTAKRPRRLVISQGGGHQLPLGTGHLVGGRT
jgi:hypothetical protein